MEEQIRQREQWETNRSIKRKPKYGKFWCHNCDEQIVMEGQKCPNCKIKPKRQKYKK